MKSRSRQGGRQGRQEGRQQGEREGEEWRKRKGDKGKLTSYRFIHLKEWAGKMMEKLAMEKSQEKISKATPETQIGDVTVSQWTLSLGK